MGGRGRHRRDIDERRPWHSGVCWRHVLGLGDLQSQQKYVGALVHRALEETEVRPPEEVRPAQGAEGFSASPPDRQPALQRLQPRGVDVEGAIVIPRFVVARREKHELQIREACCRERGAAKAHASGEAVRQERRLLDPPLHAADDPRLQPFPMLLQGREALERARQQVEVALEGAFQQARLPDPELLPFAPQQLHRLPALRAEAFEHLDAD
mmetsp:Transcript_3123/g.9091  ORF Transcript_3123/g.9091 Transcript_3123/m.9091 type:complete len:212 (-) Transcript_3123:1347-1982(-)